MGKKPNREPEFDPERVRDVSEAVYREQLGPKDVASMIEKDGDGGERLRARAGAYDALTKTYMRAIKNA